MILTIVGSSVGSILLILAILLICRWRRKEIALRLARRTQTNVEVLDLNPPAPGSGHVQVHPGITKESIDARFPTIMYTRFLQSIGDPTCTICLGDFKHNSKVRRLPCFHLFHRNCIDQWLLFRANRPVCPNC